MKILVTNDDGVYSPGMWAAVEAVQPYGEVYVVAPDREQSGVGTCVTLHGPIRATPIPGQIEGVPTYAVEGTPADAAILGIETLVGPVDLVVSGINQGANLGEDVLVSGTVGAALQGFVRNVNSIAISITALHEIQYQPAAAVLRRLAGLLLENPSSEATLLNVNLPNVPLEKLEGIEITNLGRRSWLEVVKEGDDGRRKYYWIARSRPVHKPEPDTDVAAVRSNRVSITPLDTRLTAHWKLDPLRDLCSNLASDVLPNGVKQG